MTSRIVNTRTLAIVALGFWVLYTISYQPFALKPDPRLSAVLTYRHYGALLSPWALWSLSLCAGLLTMISLAGVALGVRSARWALLTGYTLGLVAAALGGLIVMTALPRVLGGLAQVLSTAVLTLTFLAPSTAASNQRLERP